MDLFSITQLILWSFVLTIGLASSEVNITAVKPCRLGDTFRVSCKVPSKITQCLWEVNGVLKMAPSLRVLSTPGQGIWECGVEAEATEDLNGSWVCKVFTEAGGAVAEQAGTTVSIISVPSVSLRLPTARTTITAGEEKEFVCVVNDARPVPSVVWKIGDIEVDSKDYKVDSQVGRNTKATMNSVLKRRFKPEDNNKTLHCIAEAKWLRKEDRTADQTTLDVQFPPMQQNTIIYGFEENQTVEVRVTVHANPRPHRAFWILPTPSNDKIEVEGKTVGDIVANNYVGRLGEDNGNDTYTYRLNISSVQQRDTNPGIKFQVYNRVGTIEASEQYAIVVGMRQRDKTTEEGSNDDFQDPKGSQNNFLIVVAAVLAVLVMLAIMLAFVPKVRKSRRSAKLSCDASNLKVGKKSDGGSRVQSRYGEIEAPQNHPLVEFNS